MECPVGRVDEGSPNLTTSPGLVKLWIVVREVYRGPGSLCF